MKKNTTEYTIPDSAPALGHGPDWLVKERTAARDAFNTLPLPRRGVHLWRYTDPSKFLTEATETEGTIEINGIKAQEHPGGLIIDRAGQTIETSSMDALTSAGGIVTSLSAATEKHLDLVEPHLYSLVNREIGKFEALNGALWQDGVFVYVPDNVTLSEPIHLLRAAGTQAAPQYFRLLVVVGKNSDVTLIDEYSGGTKDGDGTRAIVNGAVEIVGDQDSRTRYISLQRMNNGTRFYQTHRAVIGQNATMLTIPFAFGSAMAKQNFGVRMDGAGAQSRMYGLLFGSGHQHFDNHTLHHHSSGQTYSDIDLKVVLRDKAVSAYTGLIRIEKEARTCEAYQENRNLVLNDGPKADAIPELEILNEDVSCSHGATVGPIDPMLVFYLTSRGISHDAAVRMIISGFVSSTLAQTPEDLRERLVGFVERRLEDI